MSYNINLGCWNSVFAVPTDIVDKHLKIAGSAQLKVILWMLRHGGEHFELDTIAAQLNMDSFDVKDCIEFWVSFGVLQQNGEELSPAPAVPETETAAPEAKEETMQSLPFIKTSIPLKDGVPVQILPPQNELAAHTDTSLHEKQATKAPAPEQNQTKPDSPAEKPTLPARPLRPDPVYVAKRISEDKEIEFLLNEAQYIMGRPVSPNENAGLIMMHDNDGLPCEVILMLLQYGVSNQKGMKQMESMASSWAKEGILTVQMADEKVRELEQSKEAWRKIQSILGLEFRKPSAKESENAQRWLNEWKFNAEMIKEAYDICVNAKGKYIPNYVNTILDRWYSSGITTVEQAREDQAAAAKKSSSGSSGGSGKGSAGSAANDRKSSFDIDDLKGLSMFND